MIYLASLAVVLTAWWLLFGAASRAMGLFGVDWGDMATTTDAQLRRRAGLFVLAKHVIFVALMLIGVAFLARWYPESEVWTFLIGIVWALFLFPVGLVALPVIALLWIL